MSLIILLTDGARYSLCDICHGDQEKVESQLDKLHK